MYTIRVCVRTTHGHHILYTYGDLHKCTPYRPRAVAKRTGYVACTIILLLLLLLLPMYNLCKTINYYDNNAMRTTSMSSTRVRSAPERGDCGKFNRKNKNRTNKLQSYHNGTKREWIISNSNIIDSFVLHTYIISRHARIRNFLASKLILEHSRTSNIQTTIISVSERFRDFAAEKSVAACRRMKMDNFVKKIS